MDKKIQNLLLRLGINSTYLGHKYLAYALSLCIQNEDYLTSVYKVLCMEVATHYATTCLQRRALSADRYKALLGTGEFCYCFKGDRYVSAYR